MARALIKSGPLRRRSRRSGPVVMPIHGNLPDMTGSGHQSWATGARPRPVLMAAPTTQSIHNLPVKFLMSGASPHQIWATEAPRPAIRPRCDANPRQSARYDRFRPSKLGRQRPTRTSFDGSAHYPTEPQPAGQDPDLWREPSSNLGQRDAAPGDPAPL